MNSGAVFFGLVAFALVIGIPVLAIVAITRVGTLKRKMDDETPQLISRIYRLEERIGLLEKALASATVLPENRPVPAAAPVKHDVVAEAPQPVSAPPPPPSFTPAHIPATPTVRVTSPALSVPQSS